MNASGVDGGSRALAAGGGLMFFILCVIGLCVVLAIGRRQARARASAREADLVTLLEALPIGVVIADRRGVPTRTNAAHRALWNIDPAAVRPPVERFVAWGVETGRRFGPEDWGVSRAIRGEVVSGEPVRCRPFGDGEERFYLSNAAPVRDEGGRIVGAVGVELDVTERRAAQDASRRLLATLDLGASMARDLDGTIRHWSAGCERLYGWTAAEAIGAAAHDLLRTRFPVPAAEIEHQLRTTGGWTGELEQTGKNGGMLVVAVDMALRREEAAHVGAVLEAARDITEHRRAVTALAESEARLRALTEELEDRVRHEIRKRDDVQARLAEAEKLSALGQLAGGIAHDFNNLLQSIGSGADLIEHQRHDAAKVARLARTVADIAERGAGITGRLLVFAKQSELRSEMIEPSMFLTGMSELLRHAIGVGVRLEVEPACCPTPATRPAILADRGQLETALVNLATNARDAVGPDGELVLSVRCGTVDGENANPAAPDAVGTAFRAGDYVGLAVTDAGTGMTPAVLARVSEPFFTTKAPGKGTGLGLAMARGFAEQSRGGLTVESEAGVGTRATLWFPAQPAVAPLPAPPGQPALPLVPTPTRARVLLVDDDDLVRTALEGQLLLRGYEVIAVGGSREALAALRGPGGIDLLLSDYAMPAMNGLTLIGEAQLLRPDLPAILLTGYVTDDAELAIEGARTGAYSLLRKPITGDALAARIDAVLEGADAVRAAIDEAALLSAPADLLAPEPF